jgi:tetratricopeptide (TPR) repeat protein
MSSSREKFNSEGFDLSACKDDDAIFEVGGGVSSSIPQSEKQVKKEEKIGVECIEINNAEEYKRKGNEAFQCQNYLQAIEFYTDAIEAVPTDAALGEKTGEELLKMMEAFQEALREKRRTEALARQTSREKQVGNAAKEENDEYDKEEEKRKREEEGKFKAPMHRYSHKLAVYYCNRAACFLHLQWYEKVIHDCNIAILFNPSYTKAYTRRMSAHEQTDKIEEALRDAQTAFQLEPNNKQIQNHVTRLKKLNDERLEKLKEETIGKLKDLGNSILGKFGLSLDNFKSVKDPNTGSYSISFDNSGGK